MRPLIQEIPTAHTPESLVESIARRKRNCFAAQQFVRFAAARYSFVAANPFSIFRSFGSRCEIISGPDRQTPNPRLNSATRGICLTR